MAKSKIRWLPRELLVSPYCYALCLSEKQYFAELKRLDVPRKNWGEFVTKDAAVNFIHGNQGGKVALVTLRKSKGITREQIYGLLVHEAVHIWQEVRECLGEKFPASEQEAYSVQRIAQSLMESYRDQTARKRKNTAKA